MGLEVRFSSLGWGVGGMRAPVVADYASQPFFGVGDGYTLEWFEEVEAVLSGHDLGIVLSKCLLGW